MAKNGRRAQAVHREAARRFISWCHEIVGVGGRIDLPRLMVLYAEYYDQLVMDMPSHLPKPPPLSEGVLTQTLKSLGFVMGTRDIGAKPGKELGYEGRVIMALWRARAKVVPANNRRPRVTWYDIGRASRAEQAA